ncbi:coproporphyrinogen III oxidase family protein [Eggerthellaceae bacterium zg-1084]|uniref:Heme chaperone HemW n=1 Tax=Berryella wangjianweii TaxID=2734634 RepID=A0A6M8J1Z8_9ACTN|nr:coproporphyrinogen III oxidase family protein [Berryella wangjianweii]NPD30962.1 coproporphyrinogen III oxidase family protein [Berryella wangjianweii]NPD31827.1 coproporphyrinogen III oxidase family protein [Eggerthellaceae bacterium zg-997]QKF07577.1 coproporphyrinogen III oxidase family protein [Berryella wangjianweii]
MLSERLLSTAVREASKNYLKLNRTGDTMVPPPDPHKEYMLYMHVPFCERLCPYCSFNRFPYKEERARAYFASLRKEMLMVKELGYDFTSLYVGGGTPTILIDELCRTIDLARETFSIREVSSETNPNHLIPAYLKQLEGRVQRLSVGVQSFDNGLLKQMDRYDKYGSAEVILERVQESVPYFVSMNVDMIFNFPAQTQDMLIHDVESVMASGATQTTFYPLMASPAVERSLARTVGKVDYNREREFYEILDYMLTGGKNPQFSHSSAWTYNRHDYQETLPGEQRPAGSDMIDEYVVQFEEYPAIGSGGITYLGENLYVNTFSVKEYNEAIANGRMSLMGKTAFNKHDRMRYRFLMQLFGLRLDKRQWERDFGCTVENGLPVEMAFMQAVGAFDRNNAEELTLTSKGRYLVVVMMRQFFIGVNNLRDQARSALPGEERELLFGSGCALK